MNISSDEIFGFLVMGVDHVVSKIERDSLPETMKTHDHTTSIKKMSSFGNMYPGYQNVFL